MTKCPGASWPPTTMEPKFRNGSVPVRTTWRIIGRSASSTAWPGPAGAGPAGAAPTTSTGAAGVPLAMPAATSAIWAGLISTWPWPIWSAAFVVPVASVGTAPLKIPTGTQPGQVFRLRGKGVQFLQGSGRGDHYVHISVRIPTAMTDEQRALLARLAELEGENPPEHKGKLGKLKDFFVS